MPPDGLDLDQITLINESPIEARLGDVSIFRTVEAACAYLEPWWVEAGEGFALTAAGDRLLLQAEPAGRQVIVVGRERHPDGVRLVQLWIDHLISAVRAARQDDGPASASLTEIISYLDFER